MLPLRTAHNLLPGGGGGEDAEGFFYFTIRNLGDLTLLESGKIQESSKNVVQESLEGECKRLPIKEALRDEKVTLNETLVKICIFFA